MRSLALSPAAALLAGGLLFAEGSTSEALAEARAAAEREDGREGAGPFPPYDFDFPASMQKSVFSPRM